MTRTCRLLVDAELPRELNAKTTFLAADPGTFRPMLRLALPVMAEEFLNLLVGYTDWWLVGHYLPGEQYQAAMTVVAYTLWFVPSLFAAVSIGALALVARHAGAGDMPTARRVANQALLVGCGLAGAATLGAALCGESFVSLMQLKDEAAVLARDYIWILTWVIPAIMIEQVGAACLRGAGDTVTGMAVKTVVILVNLLVSTALVTGWGPFPELGWPGLAIGTACGHGIGGLLLVVLLLRGRAGLAVRPALLWPDAALIRRLLLIGLPGGLDVVSVVSCHLVYVSIINTLGPLSSAAHGLGVQIEALAYLPGSAFQAAAATMAGQYLGAGDPRRATRGVLTTLAAGCAVMTTAGLVLYFGGQNLAGFFTGDVEASTAVLTGALLRVVAVSMPSLAVVMVLSGALRGSGDTLWPLAITFVGLVGVRLPGACLLAWGELQGHAVIESEFTSPQSRFYSVAACFFPLVVQGWFATWNFPAEGRPRTAWRSRGFTEPGANAGRNESIGAEWSAPLVLFFTEVCD